MQPTTSHPITENPLRYYPPIYTYIYPMEFYLNRLRIWVLLYCGGHEEIGC